MTPPTPPDAIRDLQHQVTALQRALARQRLLLLGLGAGLASVLTWNCIGGSAVPHAMAQDKTMEVTCRALKVVDDAGKVRLQLAYNKSGGMIRLNNADGKPVVAVEADAVGGLVSILGHDGVERAFVGVGDRQAGGLIYLKDAQGKTRTSYHVYKDGNGGLNFRNAQDKQEAFFGVSGKGFGGLVNLNGPDGKTRILLDCDKAGRGALELINADEKTEIFLGSSKGRGGKLDISGPGGSRGVILDVDDKGAGRLDLRTKDAKRLIYAGGDEEGGTCQVYGYDGKQRAFMGVGDKQTGGVFYLLNPDNDRPRVALGIDESGVGYGEGRDSNGTTKRAMK